jgi:hypothetical protein
MKVRGNIYLRGRKRKPHGKDFVCVCDLFLCLPLALPPSLPPFLKHMKDISRMITVMVKESYRTITATSLREEGA